MTQKELQKLEIEKYYTVNYLYKGGEYNGFGAYICFDFGKYYFREDNGDWMMLRADQIISIKP